MSCCRSITPSLRPFVVSPPSLRSYKIILNDSKTTQPFSSTLVQKCFECLSNIFQNRSDGIQSSTWLRPPLPPPIPSTHQPSKKQISLTTFVLLPGDLKRKLARRVMAISIFLSSQICSRGCPASSIDGNRGFPLMGWGYIPKRLAYIYICI